MTQDDGLPHLEIGPWALEKYKILKYYCEIFSTGMKNRWDELVYIDLFSGPGFAKVKGEGTPVESSPIIALKVRHPFSKYVFCDDTKEFMQKELQEKEEKQPQLSNS